jgi:hypothetical protein
MVKDFEIIGEIASTETIAVGSSIRIIKSMSRQSNRQNYVLCISNERYPASPEVRKIYQRIADQQAEAHTQIRVIDESAEDYLYPQYLFILIEVPKEGTRVFARG